MKLLVTLLVCVLIALGALAWRAGEQGFGPLVQVVPSATAERTGAPRVMPRDEGGGTAAAGDRAEGKAPVTATQPPAVAAAPGVPTQPGRPAIAGPPPFPPDDANAASSRLLLPVQGIARDQLRDTFTDARSEGRSHDAIDIMAPAGTPVLAVADGRVEKLFDSQRGGLTVYQFEPGGRLAYYYAHLQRYADGLAEGQPVRRGQVLGYVGATGNASPDAPHLHFAIFVLGPERHWWQGTAVNPYPILRGEAPLP